MFRSKLNKVLILSLAFFAIATALSTSTSSQSHLDNLYESIPWRTYGSRQLSGDHHDDAHSEDESHGHHISGVVVILFMFFSVALGVVTEQFLTRFHVDLPYTVVLFIIGIIIALSRREDSPLGESTKLWVSIDPHVLLFSFLPPLVFGEAMNLNWYYAKGSIAQSFITAGPGVVIGAVIFALFAKAFLWDWPWDLAFTFGSILAATDTVAVVSLLNSVGASPKLTILVVGESLLNDGTAMALFNIFFSSVNNDPYTFGEALGYLFLAFFGSLMFGLVFGFICVRSLMLASRPLKAIDVTSQVAITFSCAYLTFYVGEHLLGLSGILCTVGAGVMLAWLAPPIIINHEVMHNVWGMVEWGFNTVIFVLTGLIIGDRVLGDVHVADWFIAIALYILLIVTRSLTIAILFPILSRIGYGCTIPEAIFMSWSGLRGSLGMALGLIVEKHIPSSLHKNATKMFFYIGIIAALTLTVNGTTSKALLYKLKLLTTDSLEKMIVTDQVRKKIKTKMNKIFKKLSKDYSLSPKDIEEVRSFCSVLNEQEDQTNAIQLPCIDSSVHSQDASHLDYASSVLNNTFEYSEHGSDIERSRTCSNAVRARGRSIAVNPNVMKRRASDAAQITSRINQISALMNIKRKNDKEIILDLLRYIKGIYFESVRAKYWQYIDEGKLPRRSYSAQFLLHTIEVALDDIENQEKFSDWETLKEILTSKPLEVHILHVLYHTLPSCFTPFIQKLLLKVTSRHDKRCVYMLSAFIKAHTFAYKKIHSFLSFTDDDSEGEKSDYDVYESDSESKKHKFHVPEDQLTPEEKLVMKQSKKIVKEARELLKSIDIATYTNIRNKQVIRSILFQQSELVKEFSEEGLIPSMLAEELLDEITTDSKMVELKRNQMYQGLLRLQDMLQNAASMNPMLTKSSTDLSKSKKNASQDKNKKSRVKQSEKLHSDKPRKRTIDPEAAPTIPPKYQPSPASRLFQPVSTHGDDEDETQDSSPKNIVPSFSAPTSAPPDPTINDDDYDEDLI